SMNKVTNKIRYRMTYEGYPLSDNHHLSVIEQEWRDQELYNYVRPLVEVGNVLNNEDSELISGEKLIKLIEQNKGNVKLDNMKDIGVVYDLSVRDDRSLTLKPEWYFVYDSEWDSIDVDDYSDTSVDGVD